MLQKYIVLSVVLFVLIAPSCYAGKEENDCFKLLNTAVKQDVRFQNKASFGTGSDVLVNGDLTDVLYNENNSEHRDFSSYTNFLKKRAYKWLIPPTSSTGAEYFFNARRNNVGTIFSENNYLVSQVVWFWRGSNFDFPLETSWWANIYWDKYKLNESGDFKEFILYTHHLNDESSQDLLSCGIVRVIPLSGKTLWDIPEREYKTNILDGLKKQSNLSWNTCTSGFEWQYVWTTNNFYQMKTNVCVAGYDDDDLLKIEVISIAYNNGSTRLNEYVTHPLQVKAMLDGRNQAKGLSEIQADFRSMLVNETCFSVIHGAISNLPAWCGGVYDAKYTALQEPKQKTNILYSLLRFIIPSTFAKLDANLPPPAKDEGMMVYENIPYRLYQKLQSIPDENFRDYMTFSIIPNYVNILEHKKETNILLSPYEETFLSCNIPYSERVVIVNDFLEKLDVSNFSFDNLSYSNPKFWDCIVPYPDKQHLGIVIEWSFESNKLNAQKINGSYTGSEVPLELQNFAKERDSLLATYNLKIKEIEKRFYAWEITQVEMNRLKNEAQKLLDTESMKVEEKYAAIQSDTSNREDSDVTEWNNRNLFLGIIILLIISWLWVIIFTVLSKHKKKA